MTKPKFLYNHHPYPDDPTKTHVPHHFYIGFGEFSTADANVFFLEVYAWCEEMFGPRQYETWVTAGLSFYVMNDPMAFEFKMRWM
jgi:hypothetical protein